MVVNAAQLASYSQAKQAILASGYVQVRYIYISNTIDGEFQLLGWYFLPLPRLYVLWTCHHHCFNAS